MLNKVQDFIQRSIRVIRISNHPSSEEFNMTAKITGLGMVAIGIIGYIMTLIFTYINKLG